jgi:hypothetical protein
MDLLYEPGHLAVKAQEILRGYLPAWFEQVLGLGRPLTFDFGDAIYLADTSQASTWSRRAGVAGVRSRDHSDSVQDC